MKHIYTVSGMTCNGCRASVENKLNALPHVIGATVNLETAEAIIEMSQHISIKTLKQILSTKYSISEKVNLNQVSVIKTERESMLYQLFPLFLIFGYITVTAVLLNYKSWYLKGFMLDFMGLFYVAFSFFKLLNLNGFSKSFKMYDPLARGLPFYGWLYPFIEVALGVMFLMRLQVSLALIITIVVLGVTTLGVTKVLLDKKSIQCACLGTVLKLPMTKATFIENTVMIAMAIIMLISK